MMIVILNHREIEIDLKKEIVFYIVKFVVLLSILLVMVHHVVNINLINGNVIIV